MEFQANHIHECVPCSVVIYMAELCRKRRKSIFSSHCRTMAFVSNPVAFCSDVRHRFITNSIKMKCLPLMTKNSLFFVVVPWSFPLMFDVFCLMAFHFITSPSSFLLTLSLHPFQSLFYFQFFSKRYLSLSLFCLSIPCEQ